MQARKANSISLPSLNGLKRILAIEGYNQILKAKPGRVALAKDVLYVARDTYH